jgi:DNA polymerase-3 subunit alpha
MDFLGLKTLTLIKDTVKLVKYRNGIDLDPDASYRFYIFQRGETVGIFNMNLLECRHEGIEANGFQI